jgi:hypothetical protein
MEWSKKRPAVAYDLAGSNLVGCTVDDLPGCLHAIQLDGPNIDGWRPLLEAIAARHGVRPENVAQASGAGGANYLAMGALAGPGDDVLVERPAYDPILGALRFVGANIIRFDRRFEDGWKVDPQRVIDAITPATRLIVVSSPHNPSGTLVGGDALDAIGEAAERAGAHVLVDEVYLDGVYGERPESAATLGDTFVSTSSLTKAYGLSGLRAGWVLGSREVVERVNRTRDAMDGGGPMPSDTLALHAFSMLDRLEKRARSILEPNLEMVTGFIDARDDVEWVRPDGGNVAFPRVRGIRDTSELAARLEREHDTAIVPGHFFEAPPHFRIAFGASRATVEAGLDRIGIVLDELSRG